MDKKEVGAKELEETYKQFTETMAELKDLGITFREPLTMESLARIIDELTEEREKREKASEAAQSTINELEAKLKEIEVAKEKELGAT